jgi:hypothetical protein
MTAQDTGSVPFSGELYCVSLLTTQFKLQGSSLLGTRLKQWKHMDLELVFPGVLKTMLTSTSMDGHDRRLL